MDVVENRSFSGSGLPLGALKPSREVGGFAPHLFGMALTLPGAAQTPKTTDFQPNPKPPSAKPPSGNRRQKSGAMAGFWRVVQIPSPDPQLVEPWSDKAFDEPWSDEQPRVESPCARGLLCTLALRTARFLGCLSVAALWEEL